MKAKPCLVCVTGIDGVGKTTHVNLIVEKFLRSGIESKYQWLRFSHCLSLPFLALCRLAGFTTFTEDRRYSYHEFYRSRLISAVYPWLVLSDTLIFTAVRVYLPMLAGTTIVCDRFIFDTLIDLAIDTGNAEIYRTPVGRAFLRLIPGQARFVMLKLDKASILKRRPELGGDLKFDERFELYERFARQFHIPVVENEKAIALVNSDILQLIGVPGAR